MHASTVILTSNALALTRRFCQHFQKRFPTLLFDDGEASLDFGAEGTIHLSPHPTHLSVTISASKFGQTLELMLARVELHLSPNVQPRWLHHFEAIA